jgi:hypothetical protein
MVPARQITTRRAISLQLLDTTTNNTERINLYFQIRVLDKGSTIFILLAGELSLTDININPFLLLCYYMEDGLSK